MLVNLKQAAMRLQFGLDVFPSSAHIIFLHIKLKACVQKPVLHKTAKLVPGPESLAYVWEKCHL